MTTYNGTDGEDKFHNAAGNDIFNGGDGFDEISYDFANSKPQSLNPFGPEKASLATVGIEVNAAAGSVSDSKGQMDVLNSIEHIQGTAFGDVFISGAIKVINFEGFEGADTYDFSGMAKTDETPFPYGAIDYGLETGPNGIVANLADGKISDTFGNQETYIGSKDPDVVISIRGSQKGDNIIGDNIHQQFMGLAGDDKLDGGGSINEVRYDHDTLSGGNNGVIVDLSKGTATDGFGDTDTLINIQNVRGSNFNDNITGDAANNKFRGKDGDDTLDGGAGIDTAKYSGEAKNFTININAGAATTVTHLNGGEGTDSLTNIEILSFSDGFVRVDIDDVAGQAYRIYKAAFARTPDNDGLKFWIGQMDGGTSLNSVASGFTQSVEFKSVYGASPTSQVIVQKFYQNVLGRDGEAGGVSFWTGEIDSGKRSIEDVLAGFSESPENIAGVAPTIADGIFLV